jgi:hypothetical protein
MQKRASRTGVCLALAVLGLAGAGMGCSDATRSTDPTPVSGGETVFPLMARALGDDPLPVGAQLAAVRQATARFHDISAANAAGYTIPPNEPCVASPDGVMGIHAPNFALIGGQALDPTRPELLLYLPAPGGGYRLIGVEYFQTVLLRNPATGEVAPWFSQDPWPSSYQVVTPTPRLFGQTFQGPMPGHTPTMPWHWDLHAWVWAHNPSGMFAEWNPALQCE